MKTRTLFLGLFFGSLLGLRAFGAHATEAVPRSESYPWMSRSHWYGLHADDVKIAETGGVDLLFIGDSITAGWEWQDPWQEVFVPLNAANFGIGGDTTSNVLWRLQNGAVGNLAPKAVVLLIGTNNFHYNGDQPVDVVAGITSVVALMRESFPEARLLLLEIFPRGKKPDDPVRLLVEAVNEDLPKLDDGEFVFVRDIGDAFLEPDGTISGELMPDNLHLSAEGYWRWAGAIMPIIEPWLE